MFHGAEPSAGAADVARSLLTLFIGFLFPRRIFSPLLMFSVALASTNMYLRSSPCGVAKVTIQKPLDIHLHCPLQCSDIRRNVMSISIMYWLFLRCENRLFPTQLTPWTSAVTKRRRTSAGWSVRTWGEYQLRPTCRAARRTEANQSKTEREQSSDS